MTTAAPPEKMTNEGDLPCPVCSGTPYDCGHGMVACYDKKDCPINEVRIPRAQWQAARRLSEPAGDAGQWEYWDNGHEEGVKGIPAEFKSHPEDELEADLSALVKAHNAALSAPAPAAPRVGDDVIVENLAMTLRRMIWTADKQIGDTGMKVLAGNAKALLKQYGLAGNLLRGGEHSAPPAASADTNGHHWIGGNDISWCTKCGTEYDWRKESRPNVPCPPAASADDITAIIKALGTPYTADMLARALEAAGYRKLAPAQSAGQSAAQGVGEGVTPELRRAWLERLLAEAVQLVELGTAQAGSDAYLSRNTWLKLAKGATKHIRLSALPKGPSDE